MMKPKFQRLVDGETFETSEKGNSMVPLLHSGEKHVLTPVRLEDVKVGDIVYCKVKGCFYTFKNSFLRQSAYVTPQQAAR